MVNSATAGSLEKGTPLLRVRFSAHGFASRQEHCDQLANYLTTVVSSNLPEPQSWTTSLCQVLILMFRLVCLTENIVGDVELNLSNRGQLVTLFYEIPVNHRHRNLYLELARTLKRSDFQRLQPDPSGVERDFTAIFSELIGGYPTKMQTKTNEVSGKLKLLFQVHLKNL